MATIIPSINAPTFPEVQKRIAQVEPYVSWCHLDVTDGLFSKHLTWNNPADLASLKTTLHAEVHLMVEEPEKIIDQWLAEPIRRVIVHLEAMKDPELVIKMCRDAGREIGFAIKPGTSRDVFEPWLGRADLFLFLAVDPGPSGQQMDPKTYVHISHLRNACSSCMIEVDGQMNVQTIPRALAAGANLFVVGSAIFNALDIGQSIAHLQSAASGERT